MGYFLVAGESPPHPSPPHALTIMQDSFQPLAMCCSYVLSPYHDAGTQSHTLRKVPLPRYNAAWQFVTPWRGLHYVSCKYMQLAFHWGPIDR